MGNYCYRKKTAAELVHVNLKEFNASFVIYIVMWMTPANFNIGRRLHRQGLPEPRCTTGVAAPATTVAAFAVPQWIGRIPLTGWFCVSAGLTIKLTANE